MELYGRCSNRTGFHGQLRLDHEIHYFRSPNKNGRLNSPFPTSLSIDILIGNFWLWLHKKRFYNIKHILASFRMDDDQSDKLMISDVKPWKLKRSHINNYVCLWSTFRRSRQRPGLSNLTLDFSTKRIVQCAQLRFWLPIPIQANITCTLATFFVVFHL